MTNGELQAALDEMTARRNSADRCHIMAIKRFHAMGDAILNAIADGGDLVKVVHTIADYFDGCDALDDDVIALLERAEARATVVAVPNERSEP